MRKKATIYDQKHHNAQCTFDLKHCHPNKMQECSKSFSKKKLDPRFARNLQDVKDFSRAAYYCQLGKGILISTLWSCVQVSEDKFHHVTDIQKAFDRKPQRKTGQTQIEKIPEWEKKATIYDQKHHNAQNTLDLKHRQSKKIASMD